MGWSPELPQLIFYLWHLLLLSRELRKLPSAGMSLEPNDATAEKAMYNFALSVKCRGSGWGSGSQLVR